MSDEKPEHQSGMADEYLTADLERRAIGTVSRMLRNGAAVALAAFGMGGEDALPGLQLVVRRRDTHAEVIRADVGQFEEATHVLGVVREELTRKTVEQFVSEWRLPHA